MPTIFDLSWSDHAQFAEQQDLLNRYPFARQLAEGLLRLPASQSITIGILGEWGSGKSTLLNFIESVVKEKEPPEALILRFNPWWFSGREDLIQRFFDEAANQLEEQQPIGMHRVSGLMRSYGQVLSIAKLGVGLAKFGTAIATSNHLETVASTVEIVDAAGTLVGASRASASKTRIDLERALESKGTPLWIFIDDIDRLPPDELLNVFALIRAVGDLPFTRYFLALDPIVIQETLNLSGMPHGGRYLDKIIQVSVTVPDPNIAVLREEFSKNVRRILQIEDERARLLYDVDVWFTALKEFFPNLRAIYRYLNSLQVSAASIIEEAHPMDLVHLEAIKVFRPDAYRFIGQNKDLFVNSGQSTVEIVSGEYRRDKEVKKALEASGIIDLLPILEVIFPTIKAPYPPSYQDRKSRRVSDPTAFDLYFRLDLPAEIPRKQILQRYWVWAESRDDAQILSDLNSRFDNDRASFQLILNEFSLEVNLETQKGDAIQSFMKAISKGIARWIELDKSALLEGLLYSIVIRVLTREGLSRSPKFIDESLNVANGLLPYYFFRNLLTGFKYALSQGDIYSEFPSEILIILDRYLATNRDASREFLLEKLSSDPQEWTTLKDTLSIADYLDIPELDEFFRAIPSHLINELNEFGRTTAGFRKSYIRLTLNQALQILDKLNMEEKSEPWIRTLRLEAKSEYFEGDSDSDGNTPLW